MHAKINTFARTLDPNVTHAEQVCATFAKTSSSLNRFATLCDPNVVKQLAFIQPNFKMAVITCPFHTQGRNNVEVFAGSLGDSMDIICPVSIRVRGATGEVISLHESRADVAQYDLPTSQANPLEEEGPPPSEALEGVVTQPPGPDRIMMNLNVADREPCFVAIPKDLPAMSGETAYANFSTSIVTTETMLRTFPPGSMTAIWYEAMCYGIRHLDNYSIQSRDTLFRFAGIEKAEFSAENRSLASRFTTIVVTYRTPDDNLYHEVTRRALEEKEKCLLAIGARIMESYVPQPSPIGVPPPNPSIPAPTG